MLSNWNRVSTGKLGSVDAWSTYVAAPGTAVQLNVISSIGWNVEYPWVGESTGAATAVAAEELDSASKVGFPAPQAQRRETSRTVGRHRTFIGSFLAAGGAVSPRVECASTVQQSRWVCDRNFRH